MELTPAKRTVWSVKCCAFNFHSLNSTLSTELQHKSDFQLHMRRTCLLRIPTDIHTDTNVLILSHNHNHYYYHSDTIFLNVNDKPDIINKSGEQQSEHSTIVVDAFVCNFERNTNREIDVHECYSRCRDSANRCSR